MISKQEVEHIAKLARLELTDAEIEKMQKDMSEILGYFDLLKKAGTGQHPVLTKSQHRVFFGRSFLIRSLIRLRA